MLVMVGCRRRFMLVTMLLSRAGDGAAKLVLAVV
jgi:hypothetical protein